MGLIFVMIVSLIGMGEVVADQQAPHCKAGFWTRAVYEDGDVYCKPCPAGAATVANAEGWTSCIGGSYKSCPPGWGFVARKDPFAPIICVPCAIGEESIRFTSAHHGIHTSMCIQNPCSGKSLPVRRPGPIETYDCVMPMEKNIKDWSQILSPQRQGSASAADPCPPGSGFDGGSQCVPCKPDQEIVMRQGWPVCSCIEHPNPRIGTHTRFKCGDKKVGLRDSRCVDCPKGTKLSLTHGWPRCFPLAPDETPAALGKKE